MFPDDVTVVLQQALTTVGELMSPSVTAPVLGRPLRSTDPPYCLSVFALDWRPGAEYEIAADKLGQPLLPRYNFEIQALVRHFDEAIGRTEIAILSKIVRTMLYRDQDLAVALRGLSEQSFGFLERLQRWGVPDQLFYSNELKGQFLYLSTTQLWVEVEAVPAP